MNNRVKILFLYNFLFFSFVSCIKEGLIECPPNADILIGIQDKNYDNISNVEGLSPIDENLPLRSYINSLSSWKSNLNTGIKEITLFSISPEEILHTISTSSFAAGSYDFVVSGNYIFTGENMRADSITVKLHLNGEEGDDIYMQNDRFNLPLYSDELISLKRTKGKLLMQFVDFPSSITGVEAVVSNIYPEVDANFNYTGSTTVTKSFTLTQPDTGNYFGMLLAPTSNAGESFLSVNMLDADGNIIDAVKDISIVVKRNHLTLVRQRYIPTDDSWEISLFVDGSWKIIHRLILGDN